MTNIADTAESRRNELKNLHILPELLEHHLKVRPDVELFRQYDNTTKTWVGVTAAQLHERVQAWARAFASLNLVRGDRVAMLLPNGLDAVCFDLAALTCALVPVPLHAIDTPGSSAYIINDAEAKVLVTNRLLKWKAISEADWLTSLKHVVICDEKVENTCTNGITVSDLDTWLAGGEGAVIPTGPRSYDLAAIVYTSGTTGRPKGVMLTHEQILANINGVLGNISPEPDDVWLSFLPLSHTFERTTSLYTAIGMGCLVYFNRNIGLISEDLKVAAPTVMMSVPRIYDRIHAKIQETLTKKGAVAKFMFDWAVEVGWRKFCRENGLPEEKSNRAWLDPLVAGFLDKKVAAGIRAIFGGRPRLFISGGAAFNPVVAKTFAAMGINILQGYGMTESSPIISVNKLGDNKPGTVGHALPNVRVRIGECDELQVNGPSVMTGYWKREADTRAVFTDDGWLRTGDQAEIGDDGHIRIKGRIKEIIVTSTGEKIPPADLEQAIENDPLFEQALVVGENRPYIAALVCINKVQFEVLCKSLGLDPENPASLTHNLVRNEAVRRVKAACCNFPNYGIPRTVRLVSEPWTIDNGLLTPTLKLKRAAIRSRFSTEIASLYDGRTR